MSFVFREEKKIRVLGVSNKYCNSLCLANTIEEKSQECTLNWGQAWKYEVVYLKLYSLMKKKTIKAYIVMACRSFPLGSMFVLLGKFSLQQSLVCIHSRQRHWLDQQTFHWDHGTLWNEVHRLHYPMYLPFFLLKGLIENQNDKKCNHVKDVGKLMIGQHSFEFPAPREFLPLKALTLACLKRNYN